MAHIEKLPLSKVKALFQRNVAEAPPEPEFGPNLTVPNLTVPNLTPHYSTVATNLGLSPGSSAGSSPGALPTSSFSVSSGASPHSSSAPPVYPSETKFVPFIGQKPVPQQLKFLGTLLVIILAIATALGIYALRSTSVSASYITAASQMQTLSQRIAKAAQQVLLGSPDAVVELSEGREAFARTLDALEQGGAIGRTTVPASGGVPADALKAVRSLWDPTQANAGAVLKLQSNLGVISKAVREINDRNPELLDVAEQILALKMQAGAPSREIALAGQLVMLTQRMAKNANAILASDVVDPENTFVLQRDARTFRANLSSLVGLPDGTRPLGPRGGLRESELGEKLRELDGNFQTFNAAVSDITGNLPTLLGAKQAARTLVRDSAGLLEATTRLAGAYDEELARTRKLYSLLALLGALAAAAIYYLTRLFRADSDRRASDSHRRAEEAARHAAESDRQNKQNQEAILRLMNEMTAVADGDLTVRATVGDDITGAIADSVNFTVEELRALVGRITSASEQVASATATARDTSTHLLDAAETQSQQIQESSASVLRMARTINEVSASAARSVSVARQSLTAAGQGTTAVLNSISGMNEIRGQIQETSKRIKRLGESSQQIGEIIEIISDITERTQVLALNAAIQAASAGEAGRGFTVVAEEVQRLAERSAESTRQIAMIVKTIQSDTLDAVSAMERSTQGVVEGTRLSDAAGHALREIGEVSQRLAGLIEEISVTAQQQANTAGKVATSMHEILSINKQASEGTRQTAHSVGDLAKLATELRASVANFRI